MPVLWFMIKIVVHKSVALRDSDGNIFSAWLIMNGSCGTLANIIVKPEKNSPKPISIRLFGNIVLGPTKKLEIPHRNWPIDII